MKDELVLCVDRSKIAVYPPPTLNSLPNHAFCFLNRLLVDDGEDTFYGRRFPQVIPVLVFKSGDEYLSYKRGGTESRLHGLKSISIGGHVSYEDCKPHESFVEAVLEALKREAKEEVGLDIENLSVDDLSSFFYTPEDAVSMVHTGLFAILESPTLKQELEVSLKAMEENDEIHDPKWQTLDEMIQEGNLEVWAEHILGLIKEDSSNQDNKQGG